VKLKRAFAVAATLVALGALAGCMSPNDPSRLCTRGWMLAHPTMTLDELSVGRDARVRQVSEGAKGFARPP
jgi:hypothetical protein